MRIVAWSLLLLSILGLLVSLYSAAFFAWLTATPLTPPQLARARYDFYFWLVIGGGCVCVAVICVIVLVRHGRRVRAGFEVIHDD